MAQHIKALVQPQLLIWARESIGYSLKEASSKIGVNSESLAAWETGQGQPTVLQLRKAAWIYRRPFAAFYLPEPPDDVDLTIRDFRSLPEGMPSHPSPQLRLQLRRALHRREIALELSAPLGEELAPFRHTAQLSEDPDALAERLRLLLGVTPRDQFGWRNKGEALAAWKLAVERLGVLAFEIEGVALPETRGFSITFDVRPIVALNSKDSQAGRVFTLMHELVHLLLRNAGLCDLHHPDEPASEEDVVEVFSNRVGGAVLAPRDLLVKEIIVLKHGESGDWSDSELDSLANRYQVSQEVVVRRLLILGRASRDFYNRKRQEYTELYRTLRAPGTGGFLSVHDKAIRNSGVAYTELILNALYQDVISSNDAADYLELNLGHLSNLEAALGRRLRRSGTRT